MYIIIGKHKANETLLANTNPVKHTDYDVAVREAQRLARQNLNHEYFVMRAVSRTTSVETPVETTSL